MARDNYLLEWRERADLTQEQLSAVMTELAANWPERDDRQVRRKWGRTDVNKVERGKRAPDADFLRAAAAALRCTTGDILDRGPNDPLPLPPEIRAVVSSWEKVDKNHKATALNVLKQFWKAEK